MAMGTTTPSLGYTARSGNLLFAPGNLVRQILIPVTGDTIGELDETLLVNLTNAVNTTFTDAQGLDTISDDDAVPAVMVAASVTEGNSGTQPFLFDYAARWQTVTGLESCQREPFANAPGSLWRTQKAEFPR
jgi:hypothetical protein